jgi:hypothetical protein
VAQKKLAELRKKKCKDEGEKQALLQHYEQPSEEEERRMGRVLDHVVFKGKNGVTIVIEYWAKIESFRTTYYYDKINPSKPRKYYWHCCHRQSRIHPLGVCHAHSEFEEDMSHLCKLPM